MAWTREKMAARAAKELRDGYYFNLGIPTLVSDYIPEGIDVSLQSDNGMLGMGPSPTRARKTPTSSTPASRRSANCPTPAISPRPTPSAWCAAPYRPVDPRRDAGRQNGDLANWMIPGKMVKGMGGAMDLVAGVKRVVVRRRCRIRQSFIASRQKECAGFGAHAVHSNKWHRVH